MQLDVNGWKLCALPGCHEDVSGDRARMLLRLRNLKGDPAKMASLRALVGRTTQREMSRMSNDDVFDAVASLLAQNRLHVHAGVEVAKPMGGAAAPPKPAPSYQPPAPRAPSSPPPAAIDPPTFPPNANLVSQAASLVAAAAEGAPFCAICGG